MSHSGPKDQHTFLTIEEKGLLLEVLQNVTIMIFVFRYNIYPVNDINFGAMLVNSKKTRTFTIENKGDRFEFKYTINKLVKETLQPIQTRGRG